MNIAKSKEKFFNIHNIVKVKTDITISEIPDFFKTEIPFDPNFEIKLIPSVKSMDIKAAKRVMGRGVFDLGEKKLLYELGVPLVHMLGARQKWSVLAEGIDTNKTKITLTLPLRKIRPIEFRELTLLSKLYFLITQIKLLKNRFSLCHCSAVANNDLAYLTFGYAWTGKTTVMDSLLSQKFKLMADDHTIIDDQGNAYCYPERFEDPKSTRRQTPIREYLIPMTNQYVGYPIQNKAKINAIFILERGKESIKKLDNAEAIRRLTLLNLEEFLQFWNSPLSLIIDYYSYLYPELDLEQLSAQHSLCMRTLVENTPCYVVSSASSKFESVNKIVSRI